MADAKLNLEYGSLHPLDSSAGDAADWQHSAARGVVAAMQDVPEISAALDAMDDAARTDFVANLADIIRMAEQEDMPAAATPDDSADA